MEAKNVRVYLIPSNQNKTEGRMYHIYLNKEEKLNIASFLNSVVDLEELEHGENSTIEIKKVKGISSNGIMKEYDVILTCKNSKTDRDYIVYTDHSYDSQNKIRVFVAIYNSDINEPFVGYPTEKEEWLDIYELLDRVITDMPKV